MAIGIAWANGAWNDDAWASGAWATEAAPDPLTLANGLTHSVNVTEGITSTVYTAVASGGTSPYTYSLSGGVDQADFSIGSGTGAVTFNVTPDYSSPHDSDLNNEYIVNVRVTDNDTDTYTQTLTVNVLEAVSVDASGQYINVSCGKIGL